MADFINSVFSWGRRLLMGVAVHKRRPLLLLASDCVAIFGTALILAGIRKAFFPYESAVFFSLLPILVIAPLYFYIEGLYDPVLPAFPQELRKIGLGITLAYLALGIVIFLVRADAPSRSLILTSWFMALALTPLLRVQVRRRFASRPWWGRDVVLFGSAEGIARLTRYLRFAPGVGLRPAAAVCVGEDTSEQGEFIVATMPELRSEAEVEAFVKQNPDSYAVILGDTFSAPSARDLMERAGRLFPSVFLMIGYMGGDMPMWLRPVEIAHTMTLQMRQNLFDPRRLALKRLFDILAGAAGTVVLLPLFLGIALWIKMETRGPVFYTQKRLGMHGQHFNMYKFRTMVANADQVLENYLSANPEMRKEWDADQKLRHDPRITRAGAFLRKTSLDELPQFINVFLGQMSLVGPRPIVDNEVVKYGKAYAAYTRVRPGMTGMWQVSGRSDTTYAYRVSMDSYYICNWSLWMDVWILARTPLVVLKGAGAY